MIYKLVSLWGLNISHTRTRILHIDIFVGTFCPYNRVYQDTRTPAHLHWRNDALISHCTDSFGMCNYGMGPSRQWTFWTLERN